MLAAATVTKVAWDFSTLPFFSPSTVSTNLTEAARSVLRALDFEFLHYTIVLFGWHTWDYRQRYEAGGCARASSKSDFLRVTLEQVGRSEVPLADEIDFLSRYLEIEQTRFKERLRVEWDIDDAALRAQVPNLILQPIVQNALKHGIGQITTQGILRIACTRQGEQLAMSVRTMAPA